MATYATATNQVAVLKELYTGDAYMKDLVYKKNPLLALVPKDESPSGFSGKYIPVPTVWSTPQGRSATFINAQGNQTPPGVSSFFVYRVSNYQLVTITNELIEATKDNAGAFVDEVKFNMDTGFRNISNDLAASLFLSGTGSRGVIGTIATVAGVTTITLADPTTVTQFENSMILWATPTDGGSPTAAGADTLLITSVNRPAGIISGTFTGTVADWLPGYFLVQQGDIPTTGATGTGSFLKISGLAAWGPTAAVTNTESFWNVNRSTDSRLQFVFFNGSNESIEEGLIDGSTLVAREGGQRDMAFVNLASFSALEKSLGSKFQYVDVKHYEADIAFAGLRVHASPYGPITVIPDRSCPAMTAYLLQMDTLKLRSLGKAPHVLTYGLEGLEGIRVGTRRRPGSEDWFLREPHM